MRNVRQTFRKTRCVVTHIGFSSPNTVKETESRMKYVKRVAMVKGHEDFIQ